MISIALYQPDIPQNTGAILRLAACMGLNVDIIEPCGFLFDDRKLRRAGMDYLQDVSYQRHIDWQAFVAHQTPIGRKVLATRFGAESLEHFQFQPGDSIIMGRESAGAPRDVHDACDARVVIPMRPDLRSLNVAQSASILAYEACRQLGHLQTMEPDHG